MAMVVTVLRLLCLAATLQQVPPGVRYHRASDQINQKALRELKQLYATKPANWAKVDIGWQAVILGPAFWTTVAPLAPPELRKAMDAHYAVPFSGGVQRFEGRVLKTPAQKSAFWKFFLKHFGSPAPQFRKATAAELSYYWAWIPYDIEEPLWIVQQGRRRTLFNFSLEGGVPKVDTVDFVGSVSK